MKFPESQRMANVQAPMIPVVGEWIAQHPGTISLGQGVVHYRAPAAAHAAAANAAETPDLQAHIDGYASVRGIGAFLEQIEAKVVAENGVNLDQQRCVVTAGSNMGFLNAVLAIADLGDEVILLSPFYFNHEMAIEMAGCRAVVVPTTECYQLDLDSIAAAITPSTRAIVTVSPGNPTGVVFSRTALIALNRLCEERGIFHISDEAYEYFVFDGGEGNLSHFSPGSLADSRDHTISLFTLSKAYGMAGWRCGYMVVPNQLEVAVKKVQDTNLVCPPIINQMAAAAAMKCGKSWCMARIAGFQQVRDLVLNELAALGELCEVPTPQGGFYALIKLHTDQSDLAIVEKLIRDHGIALMPGSTFGVQDGCSLRIAYGALDANTVAEGMGRLTNGLRKIL